MGPIVPPSHGVTQVTMTRCNEPRSRGVCSSVWVRGKTRTRCRGGFLAEVAPGATGDGAPTQGVGAPPLSRGRTRL